jgi:hypothetical protein
VSQQLNERPTQAPPRARKDLGASITAFATLVFFGVVALVAAHSQHNIIERGALIVAAAFLLVPAIGQASALLGEIRDRRKGAGQ